MNKEIEEIMLTISQKIAEALYNAGYRKLSDNVILLDNDCFTVIAVNKSIQEIKNEVVKEFADELKAKVLDKTYINKDFNINISDIYKMIEETLKEYEQ